MVLWNIWTINRIEPLFGDADCIELSLSFRRLLDLEHEELEAQAKLEDEEHQMRLQILHELLDAVSDNTTENETHLQNDNARVQSVGLSNVATTEAEEITSSWQTILDEVKVFVQLIILNFHSDMTYIRVRRCKIWLSTTFLGRVELNNEARGPFCIDLTRTSTVRESSRGWHIRLFPRFSWHQSKSWVSMCSLY